VRIADRKLVRPTEPFLAPFGEIGTGIGVRRG